MENNPLLRENGEPTRITELSYSVDIMMEAGAGKDDFGITRIAALLGLRFKDVKEYISAF